jgi:hypothetical protein
MLTGPPPKFHGTRDILVRRSVAFARRTCGGGGAGGAAMVRRRTGADPTPVVIGARQ